LHPNITKAVVFRPESGRFPRRTTHKLVNHK
jgi:hypothetical protein